MSCPRKGAQKWVYDDTWDRKELKDDSLSEPPTTGLHSCPEQPNVSCRVRVKLFPSPVFVIFSLLDTCFVDERKKLVCA